MKESPSNHVLGVVEGFCLNSGRLEAQGIQNGFDVVFEERNSSWFIYLLTVPGALWTVISTRHF